MMFAKRSLSMTITISAFERSPDGGKGLARDTRVRWALEEVGQPYQVRLVSFRAMKDPRIWRFILSAKFRPMRKAISRCSRQGRSCFTSPNDMQACCRTMPLPGARAITWMFAALSTVEPPILELANARLLESDKPWHAQRLPMVEDRVRRQAKPTFRSLG